MKDLTVCPSILQEGYDTYSPIARRTLFDGHAVSHIFSEASPDTGTVEANEAVKSVGRISLSGAQPKFSIVVDDDKLRYIREGEQGTFILKPRPTAYQIINKDFCVAKIAGDLFPASFDSQSSNPKLLSKSNWYSNSTFLE